MVDLGHSSTPASYSTPSWRPAAEHVWVLDGGVRRAGLLLGEGRESAWVMYVDPGAVGGPQVTQAWVASERVIRVPAERSRDQV